ncbi:hypothetical protein [Aurantivibrio infirmus]
MKKNFINHLLIFGLTFTPLPSVAENQIFYLSNSELIEDQAKLDMAAYAFANRTWEIAEKNEHYFLAKIDHRGVKADVKVYLSEGNLLFQCTGTRTTKIKRTGGGGTGSSKRTQSKPFCPERWIDRLQRDVIRFLNNKNQ